MTKKELVKLGIEIFNKHGWDLSRRKYMRIPNRPSWHQMYKNFGGWTGFKTTCESYKDNMNDVPDDIEPQNKEKFTQNMKNDSGTIESRSYRITSLDEALEYFKVDKDVWEVDRYIINKWEVGGRNELKQIEVSPLFQVKIWLKRKIENNAENAIRDLMGEMKLYAPAYLERKYIEPIDDRYLVEVAIADLHLANLAWGEEVGKDYDSKIAMVDYINTIEQLMGYVQHLPIEKILLIHGNDFFHVDNSQNTTTAGTSQDVDTRWQKAFRCASKLTIQAIDEYLSPIAPVDVLFIPGNHDWERLFYLGEVVDAWYSDCDYVNINNSPNPRKYYKYGINLLGYTHGNKEKIADLPLIMATESPEWWAETKMREWHIGHRHRKGETKFVAGDTFNGISVRTIPPLCSADAWHHGKGFVNGRRAGEAYIWGHDTGYNGNFSSNIICNEIG